MERAGFFAGFKVLTNAIPLALAILGVLLANLPISFTGNRLPVPLLGLMPVYFWCLVRPDLMSPAWAFAIGFLGDVLAPGPPGVWAASFVAAYAIVSRQRDAFASFSGLGAILGFATAALIACTADYVITCLLVWRPLPVASEISEFLTSVVLYVPIAAFLGFVHRRLVGPLRSEF